MDDAIDATLAVHFQCCPVFHAILRNHWMPIAVVARDERWSRRGTTRVTTWTGVGHDLGPVALDALVAIFGDGLNGIVRLQGLIVGSVLVLTGIGRLGWSITATRRRIILTISICLRTRRVRQTSTPGRQVDLCRHHRFA